MKKLKLNLSGFDLGCIIAFVLITLLGVGGWWYLSGNLAAAQDDVKNAKADYDKVSSNQKYNVIVNSGSAKALQSNVDLLKKQVDPILRTRFLSKDNVHSSSNEDSVAWKHDLDDQVHSLNTQAKNHNVTVPDKFYYGFSSYLSANPNDSQTGVLNKQMLAINQIATILIDAPAKSIEGIRRSYEEGNNGGSGSEVDHFPEHSVSGPANAYTAYPFEISFEITSENLRGVLDKLVNSPYVFIVRGLTVENSIPNSPQQSDLEKMVGPAPSAPSLLDANPGEVAAAPPAKGPQYLFGNSFLKVKMRLDLIEWNAGLVK